MGSVSLMIPLSGCKEALRCPWKRGVILGTPLSGINEGLRCPWKRGHLCIQSTERSISGQSKEVLGLNVEDSTGSYYKTFN